MAEVAPDFPALGDQQTPGDLGAARAAASPDRAGTTHQPTHRPNRRRDVDTQPSQLMCDELPPGAPGVGVTAAGERWCGDALLSEGPEGGRRTRRLCQPRRGSGLALGQGGRRKSACPAAIAPVRGATGRRGGLERGSPQRRRQSRQWQAPLPREPASQLPTKHRHRTAHRVGTTRLSVLDASSRGRLDTGRSRLTDSYGRLLMTSVYSLLYGSYIPPGRRHCKRTRRPAEPRRRRKRRDQRPDFAQLPSRCLRRSSLSPSPGPSQPAAERDLEDLG